MAKKPQTSSFGHHGKLHRYNVSLPGIPVQVIDAVDEEAAVLLFKEKNGIIKTKHTATVKQHTNEDGGPLEVEPPEEVKPPEPIDDGN